MPIIAIKQTKNPPFLAGVLCKLTPWRHLVTVSVSSQRGYFPFFIIPRQLDRSQSMIVMANAMWEAKYPYLGPEPSPVRLTSRSVQTRLRRREPRLGDKGSLFGVKVPK